MKQLIIVLLFITAAHNSSYSQENPWKTDFIEKENIHLKYRITDRINHENKKVQKIEYHVSTTIPVDINSFIAVMKDVPRHKEFYKETELSKKVKDLSENEWIIYYYSNSPWPLPDSDCVMKMVFNYDEPKKMAIFIGNADASLVEPSDVRRMDYYHVEYKFQVLDSGETKFSIFAQMTPVVKAPDWLVSSWFPKGPTESLQAIIAAAQK